MVYTTEAQGTWADFKGTATLVPNVAYSVKFELLRNDLGAASEKASDILVDGTSLGECNPDGGDYDCTFFNCPVPSGTTITSVTGIVQLRMKMQGHSSDCDCDETSWQCSRTNSVAGRTAMTAVGRYTFTPM